MRDSTAARYPTFSQKSPDVEAYSPNEEAEQPELQKENVSLNIKTKLDTLLKHNSQLLNENAQLSELVNSLRMELDIRVRREETEFAKINQEMGSVMVELKGQQDVHDSELERLLT
jgi:hypothetical protein